MNDLSPPQNRDDRCPGTSYTDMLNADTRRVPPRAAFSSSTSSMGQSSPRSDASGPAADPRQGMATDGAIDRRGRVGVAR